MVNCRGFLITLIVLCALYLLIGLSAPILSYFQVSLVDDVYRVGRSLCHQRPTRCLWLLNDHTALCGKCIGLYSGLLLTLLVSLTGCTRAPGMRIGIVGLAVALLAATHSYIRATNGGYLLPVSVNAAFGFAAGVGLGLTVWAFSNKWEDVIVKVWRRSWIFVVVALVVIHVIGFSNALAADIADENEIYVPSGTPVVLQTDAGCTTDIAEEGDIIVLRVVKPVKVKKAVVIRAGVAAKAQVIACKKSGGWGKGGEMILEMRTVEAIDGSDVRLTGRVSRKGEDEHGTATAVAVGTGLLCLPLAFTGAAVEGQAGKIPAGYEVTAHTDGDHYVKILPEGESRRIAEEQDKRSREELEKYRQKIEEYEKKEKETQKKEIEN